MVGGFGVTLVVLTLGVGQGPMVARDVAAPLPDTLVQVWVPPAAATAGGRVHVRAQLDIEGTDLSLGRVVGHLRFEPTLLAYEDVVPAMEGAEVEVDATGASRGTVGFSLVREDSAPPVRNATIVEVRFLVTGPPGSRPDVILELDGLHSAPDGNGDRTDLLPWATVRNGVVLIR
jgi:hypothetical protein